MSPCILPDEIPDWRLEAYLDGEGTPEIERHVMECSSCAERMAQLRGLSGQLKAALYRVDCSSADDLRAYRWKEMPSGQAGVIAEHLLRCQACRRELTAYGGPESALAFERSVEERSLLRQVGLFIAQLVVPAQPTAPALRGTVTEGAVYQVAETGWEVALKASTEARGYALAGQVLGPEPAALAVGQVTALADGQPAQGAPLDASGWFTLRALAPGQYALWIEVANVLIHLPSVEIGPAR